MVIKNAVEMADEIKYLRRQFPQLTDGYVLGSLIQPCDREAEWVIGRNNYVWFFLLGNYFKPNRVLEIGCRFGYSLHAVTYGAACDPNDCEMTVYDAEVDYDIEPLKVCEKWFKDREFNKLTINRQDTQKLTALSVPHPVDFATVDANHSFAGAYHDCALAWECLLPGGVMVIDDTLPGEVRNAVEQFAVNHSVPWGFLPSLRGIHIIIKPE